MQSRSLAIYDALGLGTALTLAAIGAWSGLVHLRATSQRLRLAEAQLERTTSAVAGTEQAVTEMRREVGALQADIDQRGALPSRSPVEAELRTLARMARDNRMEVVKVSPMGDRVYPGITELKYSVEARAGFDGLLGFLRDFRRALFWADITDLNVDNMTKAAVGQTTRQQTAFVVSLFASEGANVETDPSQ